jgi:hypothetical protein
MISDEPAEDADLLDDEAALGAYLGDAPAKSDCGSGDGTQLPDWPPRAAEDIRLYLDAETVAWFQAASVDWRREMRFVLRAWVAAKAAEVQTLRPVEPPIEAGRPEDRP